MTIDRISGSKEIDSSLRIEEPVSSSAVPRPVDDRTVVSTSIQGRTLEPILSGSYAADAALSILVEEPLVSITSKERDEMIEYCRKGGVFAFKHLDEKYRKDPEIVLAAVKMDARMFQFVSEELKGNVKIVLAAVKNYGPALQYATEELKRNSKIVLAAINNYPFVFEYASEELKGNLEIVLAAVKNDGRVLRYVAKELKGNLEVVLAAVKNYGPALQFASEELRADREIVLAAISKDGSSLYYAAEGLKADREIVLAAVSKNGSVLQYAVEELKADREIVLAAVSKNGSVLQYAAEELKADREIVLAAVGNFPEAFKFAAREIQENREILLVVPNLLGVRGFDRLSDDRLYVMRSVRQDGMELGFASRELRNDREVVLEAIRNDGRALKHASRELRNDREVVLEAIRNIGFALEFGSSELRNDRGVVLEAIRNNGSALEFASSELKNDRELVLEAIRNDGSAVRFASSELKNDREFVLEAIRKSSLDVFYLEDAIKDDEEIAILAVRRRFTNFRVLSSRLMQSLKLAEDCSFVHECFKANPRECIKFFKENSVSDAKIKKILKNAVNGVLEKIDIEFSFSSELKDRVLEMITKFKDFNLQGYLVSEFIKICSAEEDVRKFLHLIEAQTEVSHHQGRLMSLIALNSLKLERSFEKGIFQKIYKSKELKDAKKLQGFLQTIQQLSNLNLDDKTIRMILRSFFTKEGARVNFEQVQLVFAISVIDPTVLADLESVEKGYLISKLTQKLRDSGFIDERIEDFESKFYEKFIQGNSRYPAGIFVYAAMHKDNPKMVAPIKAFIQTVVEGTFVEYRNASNKHLDFLTEEQRMKWETSLLFSTDTLSKDDAVLNVKDFLKQKLEQDLHGGAIIRKEIFDEDERGPAAGLAMGGAGAPRRRVLNEIEDLVLRLADSRTDEESLALIAALEEKVPDSIEFKNDLRALKDLILHPKSGMIGAVEETENPFDLFLQGTEVEGSCQRIDGDPKYNCCLMGYCLDGKIRTLVMRDADGKIKSRVLVKLLLKDNDEPVLFMDRIYPVETPAIREAFLGFAKRKAESVGVDLYVEGYDEDLCSLGCPAPYEYEDAGRCGVTNGKFNVSASKVTE
jgi:hypothetical protein